MTRIFLFLLLLPAAAFADPQSDAQSASRNVLEIYLDRAEGARSEQDWKAAADWGLQAAQAAWEKGAALWNEDDQTLAGDRQSLNDVLSADVTRAWQTWLVNRFYQGVATDTLSLTQAAARADLKWLYQTDVNGGIVYDAAGNPVVLVRSSGEEDVNDTGWKTAVAGSQQALLGSWDQTVQASLPELLARPGADQAQLGALAAQVGAVYRDRYRRELDALYLQQVSRYASTRVYDQFSLKKKSADETAGSIVDQLIRDVRSGTDAGIQAVKASLSLSGESVTADSQVNAAQWEASFRQVLDSGLAKWDIAEKQLLAQRTDWENRAGASYQSGEAAWAAAYSKLTQERTVWQNQLKGILAAGQAQWDGKQAELAASIAEASQRLDEQLAQQQTSTDQRVSGLVDVYTQSQNLVQTAQTSGEYWFNRMVDPHNLGTSKVYSWTDMNKWAASRIGKLRSGLQTRLNSTNNDIDDLDDTIRSAGSYLSQLSSYSQYNQYPSNLAVVYTKVKQTHTEYHSSGPPTQVTIDVITDWNFVWHDIVTKDVNVLKDRRQQLKNTKISLEGKIASLQPIETVLTTAQMAKSSVTTLKSIETYLATGDDGQNGWESYNEGAYWLLKRDSYQALADSAKSELSQGLAQVMGAGGNPQDILRSTDLESGYIDEYQVALLKAQVQQQYWEREYQIAQQVYAYATDTSSSRPTEAQEQEAWNRALADYQAKKDAYAQAVAALEAEGRTVAQRQAGVDAAQTAMDAARTALQQAQNEYSAALAARAANKNTTFYDQQIGSYEQDLEKLYGLADSTDDTLAGQLVAYRAALRDYGEAQELAGVQSQLKSLVLGVAAQAQGAGTPSLAQLQQTVLGLLDPAEAVKTAGSIPATDGQYGAAAAAVQAAWATAAGDEKDLLAAQFAAYYRAYSGAAATGLKQRQAQVALLVSGTGADWYQGQTGRTSTDVDASLAADQSAALGALLEARLKLAADAWSSLASGAVASTAEGRTFAALIAAQHRPDAEVASAWRTALDRLIAAGDAQGWWTDPGAHRPAIAAALAAETDPELRAALKAYVGGSSGVAISAYSADDASVLLVPDAGLAISQAGVLQWVWQQGAASSASGIAAAEVKALADWHSLWSSQNGGTSQADAKSIGNSVTAWAEAGTLEASTAEAVAKIRALEAGLRPDLRDAAETLAASLINLAALKAQTTGSTDIAGAQAQAQAAHAAAEALATLAQKTLTAAASSAQGLKQLSDLAAWARSDSTVDAALGAQLDAALAAVLAPAIVQARFAATSSDPWNEAASAASSGLSVTSSIAAAAMSQAQSLYTRLTSGIGTLAELAADPTSVMLGTVAVDAAHLDIAQTAWTWVGQSREAQIDGWRQGLDPASAAVTDRLFTSWNAADEAGQAGLATLMGGQSTQAAQDTWTWFQTNLGGVLTPQADAGHSAQQSLIDAYLAGLTDVTQAGWAGQLFASLQTEADAGRTDLSAVLADALGSAPDAKLANAWTLISDTGTASRDILDAAWAAGSSDQTYAASLLAVLRYTADSGGDARIALIDALSPRLREALAAARGAGALAALRERALAVTLASKTAAGQYGFLASLAGVRSFGSIDASVYGSGEAFEATFEGFASDQATVDLVLGWYLKAKAVSGYGLDQTVAARLSSSARSGVAAFASVLTQADGYVGLGEDPAIFSGGTSASTDVMNALASGSWEDDFFLASMAGAGKNTASLAAQVEAWRLGALEVLKPSASVQLAASVNDAFSKANAADTAVEFRQAVQGWKDRIAAGDTPFRQYLDGLKDSSGDDLDTVLKASASGWQDQAQYELEWAVRSINDGAAETSDGAVRQDFVTRYARFAQGTSDFTDADVYHPSDAVQSAYLLAADKLGQVRGRLAADQGQISKLGKIRADVMAPPSDAETKAKALAIQTALTAYTTAETSLEAAITSLTASMTVYNQHYQSSNGTYQAAEDARYAFEAQDQILTYAQNGYLSADDPTLQLAGYQSPTQLLATATAMRTRSQSVLATLTAVTPSTANADSQVGAVDTAYRTDTLDLLALSALQDQLAAQIARQDVVARAYGDTYQENSELLVKLTPGQLKDEDTKWAPYLLGNGDKGLSLNMNLTTFELGTRSTGAQTDAWEDFTSDPEVYDEFKDGTFAENLAQWESAMQAWQKSNPSGYQETLKKWGLAFDYMIVQIKNNAKNTALAGFSDLMEAAQVKDLTFDGDDLDDFLLGSESSVENDIRGDSGNNNYVYLKKDYRDWMRAQMTQAWSTVKGDGAHWDLFQNALSFYLTGSLADDSIFTVSAPQKAFGYIRDRAQDKADDHNDQSSTYTGIAIGYAAAGAALWWVGGGGWFFAMAAAYGIMAADEHQKAIQQQNLADITGRDWKGMQVSIANSLGAEDLKERGVAWTDYSKAWTTLQTLKGAKATVTMITADTLEKSLSTALGQRHADDLSDADRALIRREFALLSDADKTDSVTALAAIVRLAQTHQTNSRQDLAAKFSTLQTQFQADEAAYKNLEAKYLAGDPSVTLAQLQTQAQATYGSPVYTALIQAQKQMAADGGNLDDPTTALSGKEAQKASLAGRLASTISQLESVRLAHLKQVRLGEWTVRQQELNTQQSRWENQITATVVKSQQAWSDSFGKLNTGYQSWRVAFSREYQDKSDAWSAVYHNFQWSRRQWVDAVATSADQAQNEVWAISAGQAVEGAISRNALTLIGDMGAGMVSSDGIVSQILGTSSLASYLKGAQRINGSLAAVSTGLRQGAKLDVASVSALAAIKQLQNQRNEELEEHAALIVAVQARDNIAAAQKAYGKQVEGANESFDLQMDHTFQMAGYHDANGQYTRRSIIGSTIMGPLYETQRVDTYRPFTSFDFSVSTSLDDTRLQGMDADGIQLLVSQAMDELQDKSTAIFGPSKKDKKDDPNAEKDKVFEFVINGGDSETDTSKVNQKVQTFKDKGDNAEDRTVVKTVAAGTFNAYLGYTPEMKSDPKLDTDDFEAGYKASVLIPGTGETGRLIGWYQYFQMRAGKGWAEQDQPFYSQKLYDDRNSWIKSPTLKDVAMTGVGIAAALMTGGTASGLLPALIAAGQTAGMTIGADALFTAADVAHGADASQSWGEFGKRSLVTGLTSALTLGVGKYGLGLDKMAGQAFGSLGGSMVYAGGMSLANKGVSTSIGAINWEDGHIGFDEEAFAQSWDVSNLSNYSSVLTAATGVLGSELTRNVGGDLAAATNWNTKLTGSIGNLAGMMTGQALAYGTSMIATTMQQGNFNQGSWGHALDNMGGINVNLASAGMLLDMVGGAITMNSGNQYDPMELQGLYEAAGKLSNTGLFEMNINSQGTTGRLGQGGVNLGGAMWDVAKHSYGQMNIEAMAKTMTQSDAKQRLTDLYSSGDYAAEGLVNRLGARIDRVAYAKQASGGWAETTTTATGRLITLDTQFETTLGATGTVALTHESWRNGRDDGELGQLLETNTALGAHLRMALAMDEKYGEGALTGQAAEEVKAYRNNDVITLNKLLGSYDSSADYWKVIKGKDGKLAGVIDDGDYEHVTLVDEFGAKLDVKDRSGSLTQQIADMLSNGMTKQQVNDAMAQKYGLDWNGTSWHTKDADKQRSLVDAYATPYNQSSKYYSELERYYEAKYGVVAQTPQPKDQPGYWEEYQRAMVGANISPVESNIVKTLAGSLTEEYVDGNLCDDFTIQKFKSGGIDLTTILGDAGLTANEHYAFANNLGILSDKPKVGLNVFLVDWADSKGNTDGMFDHFGAIYVGPDGSVTVYNHGGSDHDVTPYQYKDYYAWMGRDSWKGKYKFTNSWGK